MPKTHKVRSGDGISPLALEHGFFPDTIWNHPENKKLKETREHPNALVPGDLVHIPDRVQKTVGEPTDNRHRFRLRGVPAKLRIQLLSPEGEPRADQSYTLSIDGGPEKNGSTNSQGVLEDFVAPDAESGLVIVGPDACRLELTFQAMESIKTMAGVQSRLLNLGYECDPPGSSAGEETTKALLAFQADNRLETTGALDDATRKELAKVHDNVGPLPQASDENQG